MTKLPADLEGVRVALAHDWLVGLRGGEWVLDRLARLFGPTELYTLVTDGRPLTNAIDACRVTTSYLQTLPGAAGKLRRWYLPLMPGAVDRLRVQSCDLLISTSSAVMKGIRAPGGIPHLCYCHTPARYIWEQGDDYARGSRGGLRAMGLRMVRERFKKWDRARCANVTWFLANSAHTAARIRRCYGREADVVYPPVRTDYFTPDATVAREEWLLVVAALEPYKRTDLVIEAARRAGWKLKVAGSGSQIEQLRSIAGPRVEFLGRVSDEKLRDLYRRARVLVFPQEEDFGIIAVEAQACGCQVLAYAAGGAKETVSSAVGEFFERQHVDDVIAAYERLAKRTIDARVCRANAERFGNEVFDTAILAHAGRLLAQRA